MCLNKAIKNFKKEKPPTLLHVSVQSVASIGNTLNSVHLAVEAIQKTVDEHKKTVELLQSDMVRKSTNATESQHTPPAHSRLPSSVLSCDTNLPLT